MDITLADVTNSVPHPNQVCIPDNDRSEDETLETWMDVETLYSKAWEEDIIQIVGKHVRTTDSTPGILHGIKVDISPPPFKTRIDENETIATVSVWIVRSIPGPQAFSPPSDSGSFIYARKSWRVDGHRDLG